MTLSYPLYVHTLKSFIQIVKEHVGQVSLDPSAFQCCASLLLYVVHLTSCYSACQPFVFIAVVRLSYLEDVVLP